MTVPIPHLRAMLDAFERRGIDINRITVDGGNLTVQGGALCVDRYASGTYRAIARARSVRIMGEGETAEEAIAAAIYEARMVADEAMDALAVPIHPEAPRSTP